MLFLAARCDGASSEDGAGFNKIDAGFGRSLARRELDRWTPEQLLAARRMIVKYAGQLPAELAAAD